MALSGSTPKIYTSKGAYWVWVEWSATQSIENNTSTVTAITYAGTNSYGWYTTSNNGSDVVINGQKSEKGDSGDISANTVKRELHRNTVVVSHSADGSKALVISGRWWMSGNASFDLTSSGTFTLDTIPRASSISSISGGALGAPVTVNISRASTAFTHTVIYKRTDGVNVTVGTSQGTSCTFTPALSDAQFLPNSTSGTATIIVHTYNGSTHIGTATRTFTVTVPASVVPTVSIATAGVDQYNGYYVQGRSKVTVTLSATGAQGSSISSRSTVVRYGSTNITASNNNSFTSGVLNYSGTITIATTVTDSRGRSASSSTTISVVAYAVPSVTGFSAYRSNADGNANAQGAFIRISGTGSIASINSTNGRNTVIRYRERGASSWINAASNTTSYTPSLNAVVAADVNKSYEAQIVVADYFTSSTQLIDIGTAFVLMDFHSSGNSMAIGKVAENKALLEIGGDMTLDGMISNLNIGRKTSTSAVVMADAAAWAALPLMKGVMINPSGSAGLPEAQYYYVVKIAMRDMSNGYGGIAINYSTGDFYTFVASRATVLPAFTFIGPQ